MHSIIVSLTLMLLAAPAGAADSEKYVDAVNQAVVAAQKDDPKSAIALLTKAVDIDPNRHEAYLLRGQLYVLRREFEKAITDLCKVIQISPTQAQAWEQRGEAYFCTGKVKDSLADFDKFIQLQPEAKPYLWQRGISCYYEGQYAEGRKQFEVHQTVNKHDVENAVWHFLCVAKLEGVESARKQLIPIWGDRRVPMMEIYNLFAGKGSVEKVMAAERAGNPDKDEAHGRGFHANLYLALYFDIIGNEKAALDRIAKATGDYKVDSYMGDVARVHEKTLRERPEKARQK